ncbi:MAG: gingipain R, partial [Candidatus Cloacimonadaceae bacterium]|nr:gingipain R [Candidatus Cloacimonadaceae bacterium]
FKPSQQTISIDPDGSLVYFGKLVVVDGRSGARGNADGFANAGETIALWVDVKNSTQSLKTGISAILSSDHPDISITQSASTYPNIASNANVMNNQAFLISIDSNIAAYSEIRFDLDLVDANDAVYHFSFSLPAYNARLDVVNYTVNAGANATLDPGEDGLLQLSVKNNSIFAASDIYGELSTLNDLISLTTTVSYFGNIPANAIAFSLDNFALFARPALVPGMQIPLKLRLYNASGFEQESFFSLPIGSVAQNTPLGPDTYGYFIYDMTDLGYPDTPSYNWIEIHPSLGGNGTLIPGFSDSGSSGEEGDMVGSIALQTVTLPFTFPFYGVDYTQITVCVNGFIAMGITEDAEFRNSR